MSRVLELQLSEICLSLQSEEKKKRQKSLEKLKEIANKKNDPENCTKSELQEIWQIINKHVSKHITDNSELCRNLSIEITKIFIQQLPVIEKNIIYTVPILVRRLGSQEIHEESEEVRLNCVILIREIMRIYKDHLSVYHDDFLTILSQTVTDNYPKLKIESCLGISELASSVPSKFYNKSQTIIKPITSNFTHQHYRVRVASVNTIGHVLLYGNSKDIEQISTPMAERLFDQSAAVRSAVIKVAGMWLMKMRDRYSWWFRLIPLLLTGLHDEIQEIRKNAGELWSAVGQLYLKENDNDEKIKDKLDFLIDNPVHYPPNIERPNLGCRIIVQQNIGRLVGGISKELNDWLADIRVRSAQLLAVLVLNAEEDITQHISKLLPAMYRACNDEDKRVIDNVILAAEFMGYFVPPEVYCKLVLPTLDEGNINSGHLSVFSALIRTSTKEKLTDKLEDIGRFLQEDNICRSKKTVYQKELLKCCDAILSVCQENCSVISEELFKIIFTIWSMTQEENLKSDSKNLLTTLTKLTNAKNIYHLFDNHIRKILNDIKNSPDGWTMFSPELYILKNCLQQAKIAVSKNIDIVIPILKIIIGKNSTDPELRLKMLILLSEYFQKRDESLGIIEKVDSFVGEFIEDILMPSLIWQAGKSAEAVRTSALGCLCSLLDDENFEDDKNEIFIDDNGFKDIYGKLKPIIVSLIDDNSQKTRLFSLKAIYLLLRHAVKISCVNDDDDVIEIYPAIIKRLDDGSDDVRFTAVEALVFVFQILSDNYDVDFGKGHIDYLYTSTIIHLDDPEKKFQDVILDAMIQLAKVHPRMLYDKIEKCKMNFRNQNGLEKIQKTCQQLLINSQK